MKLDQIRWESVAKIGAGVLLAVAIVTSAPSLLDSEKPEPLDPDVGLPQAAIPPPGPPGPPSPPPKPPKEHKSKPKRPRKPRKPAPDTPSPAPVTAGPVYTAPAGAPEDFGFEQP